MNPRKYPRTMQEAFGPYTSFTIDEPRRPIDLEDKIVIVGSAIALVTLVVFIFAGVIR